MIYTLFVNVNKNFAVSIHFIISFPAILQEKPAFSFWQ